jgi:DnaJ-class molecular chaperone
VRVTKNQGTKIVRLKGDLRVKLKVHVGDGWRRSDLDLIYTKKVDLKDALSA